ncbi:MAG: T9SS type A sorting domain-containing protein, partial [Bacteroidales bacterium]|nr:T9SS type A sorting domain-containing protein [Bacteroidales bacterium]
IEGAEPPYNPMDDSEFKNLRLNCNTSDYQNDTDDSGIGEGTTNIPFSEISGILLYPNPVTDLLNVRSNTKIERLDIIDMAGNIVISKSPVTSNYLSVANLAQGVYIVLIQTAKETITMKIQRAK